MREVEFTMSNAAVSKPVTAIDHCIEVYLAIFLAVQIARAISECKYGITYVTMQTKFFQEHKELGKPKRPMSSYFLFINSRRDNFRGKNLKEFQEQVKKEYEIFPQSEKAKLEKQAQDLMAMYKYVNYYIF